MGRNVTKQIEEGRAILKKHSHAVLYTDELFKIRDISAYPNKEGGTDWKNTFLNGVINSFAFGVAVGSRIERSKKK